MSPRFGMSMLSPAWASLFAKGSRAQRFRPLRPHAMLGRRVRKTVDRLRWKTFEAQPLDQKFWLTPSPDRPATRRRESVSLARSAASGVCLRCRSRLGPPSYRHLPFCTTPVPRPSRIPCSRW